MTKKERKVSQYMSIFELKMAAKRPDIVDAWDVTAKDPFFLIELK